MKKFILGIVVGLLIGSVMTAMAAQVNTVQAVFAKFYLKINNENPVEITPLTYNGTTYLPVRQLGDLLGYEVGYDKPSRTIIIKSKEVSKVQNIATETISLRDLTSYLDGVTLGPFEKYNNVLSLTKGSVTVRVLDFVPPKDNARATYVILGGGSIDAEFKDGNTYFPKETLKNLGLLTD